MKLYLAGPMSGIPAFNIPMFDAIAEILRRKGYEIISPAELDDDHIREACLASPDGEPTGIGGTWGDFLSRDVKIVADEVDGIVLMPGWYRSRGAGLEAYVAITTGKELFEYAPSDATLDDLDVRYVMNTLKYWAPRKEAAK